MNANDFKPGDKVRRTEKCALTECSVREHQVGWEGEVHQVSGPGLRFLGGESGSFKHYELVKETRTDDAAYAQTGAYPEETFPDETEDGRKIVYIAVPDPGGLARDEKALRQGARADFHNRRIHALAMAKESYFYRVDSDRTLTPEQTADAVLKLADKYDAWLGAIPSIQINGRLAEDSEERPVGRRAVADDDEIARHAEKQGVSWADAWRYFEINGYDMSTASPQYDS